MIKKIIFYLCFLVFTLIVSGCGKRERSPYYNSSEAYEIVKDKKPPETVKIIVSEVDGTVPPSDGRRVKVIRQISVLDYIKGVINGEMPKMFQKEYAKVQTVLSYTYFIFKYLYNKKMGLEYIPDSSELEQKYIYEKNSAYSQQIEEVFGTIITYNGKVFPPFYHSTCGGVTDNAYETFEDSRWKDINPLQGGVKCSFCSKSPHFLWYLYRSKEQMKKTFHVNCKDGLKILPEKKSTYGNIVKIGIYCGGALQRTLNIFSFRDRMSRFEFKSYSFDIEQDNNNFVFSGKGFGHRVGLCQYGANEMIRLGYSYIDVLKYYYPGITIVRIEKVWESLRF